MIKTYFSGIEKNKMIDMIKTLNQPNFYNNYREVSILVTGLSVDPLAKRLFDMGIYENEVFTGKSIESNLEFHCRFKTN